MRRKRKQSELQRFRATSNSSAPPSFHSDTTNVFVCCMQELEVKRKELDAKTREAANLQRTCDDLKKVNASVPAKCDVGMCSEVVHVCG
jgi:hypothetical protein